MKRRRKPVDLMAQRKIALLFIATGSLFTVIASILGLLMMLDRSLSVSIISSRLFSVHPLLQIFGFLTEFVLGVSYSLIPSFKSHGLPSYRLAVLSYGLITAANAGFLLSVLIPFPTRTLQMEIVASLLIELVASLIFIWETTYVILNGRKTGPIGDGYILISAISLLLSLSAVTYSMSTGLDPFSTGVVYLALAGFVGSMIFGVTMKTVAIRFTSSRKSTYRYGLYLQSAGIAAAFVSVIFPVPAFSYITAFIFLFSAVLFVLSSRTLSQSRLLISEPERSSAHTGNTKGHAHLLHMEASMMVASSWLLIGILFSILYFLSGYFWIRIAFIHSLSIGFVGSTIMGIAPVLLPGILSRNTPSGITSFLPLYLLNTGLVIFIAGDIMALGNISLPFWTGIGGITIVLSMAYFLYDIHKNLISKNSRSSERTSFSDDW